MLCPRLPSASSFAVRCFATSVSPPSTPLFLRPFSHTAAPASIHTFHVWASRLASQHPDPPHLLRELSWLLLDATSIPRPPQTLPLPSDPIRLRLPLADLYALWQERVEARRPLQYIVGCEHWRDLVLVVREGVLIPRPETEQLVDLAGEVDGFRDSLWVDLGTGSGALAVALGKEMLGGRVIATDASADALEVAEMNVERYGLEDKVEIRQGSWFEPLQDVKGKIAGLVSNPPYIPSSNLPDLQAEVGKHEPWLALDGGADGMGPLLHLCEGCCSVLKSGGFFAFETNGDEQSDLLVELLNTKWGSYFWNVKTFNDFAGVKRFVSGYRR